MRWARRAFSPWHDAVVGDLVEDFQDDAGRLGETWARVAFPVRVLWAAFVVRYHFTRRSNAMLKINLLLALRNLRKSKVYSVISILGLAVSMSVCLTIIALVSDQLNYDRFHENADRIVRVTSRVEESRGRFVLATAPGPLGPEIMQAVPDVERVLRMVRMGGNATYADQTSGLTGLYAEASFFDLFDFPFVQGNPVSALVAPFSLVITRETAERFFGSEDPMGKAIMRAGVGEFTVTGVLEDLPLNTHLRFEALSSYSTLTALDREGDPFDLEDWNVATGHYTYLLLGEDADVQAVATRSQALVDAHWTLPDKSAPEMGTQALTNIALGPDMSNQIAPVMPLESTYFLFVFGGVLLAVAIFNYVSLTIARSIRRSREIGIRKVVGARRAQIVRQFTVEAVVVAVLSLLLACAIMAWLVPAFNGLSGFQEDLDMNPVTLSPFRDGGLYLVFLGFAVGVGVLAGLIPAFRISNYTPSSVLRGATGIGSASIPVLRKALVVFQFTLAITSIVITIVIHRQLSMVLEADYGFGESGLLAVDLQGVDHETVRSEFERIPGVVAVAATSSLPSTGSKAWTTARLDGSGKGELVQVFDVDDAFLEQLGIDRVAGRTFEGAVPNSEEEPILLTVSTVETLGFPTPADAVGATVWLGADQGSSRAVVRGVVQSFYSNGYDRGYASVVLRLRPERYNQAVVRFRPQRLASTIEELGRTWHEVAPTAVFTYAFYDERLDREYAFMRNLISFLGLFAGFVILISCLGLLGMTSHAAESRVREVGIRRVMGADVPGTVYLLSKDYVLLLAIAVVVATPLTILLAGAMLQKFANRVSLDTGTFLFGIIPILGLALLTVGSQTVRAALANPVDTLRRE